MGHDAPSTQLRAGAVIKRFDVKTVRPWTEHHEGWLTMAGSTELN